jgi:hypothetical protein
MLKARLELLRVGDLTEIKSRGADVHGNRDIFSFNIAGEEHPRNCGAAQDGPGTHDSYFGCTCDLLMNFTLIVRFIDNESPGDELDTSKSEMPGAVVGRAWRAAWRLQVLVANFELGDSYTKKRRFLMRRGGRA